MGKKLIIKGADFSENALAKVGFIDITDQFLLYKANYAINVSYPSVTEATSALFNILSLDISSDMVGGKLRITIPRYTTGAGDRSFYGFGFVGTDGQTWVSTPYRYETSTSDVRGEAFIDEVVIPSGTTKLFFSWFNLSARQEYGIDEFKCYQVG